MDKRTFLFVIALSLTLMGVSQFFNYQNEQKRKEWLAQQQQINAVKEQKLRQDVAQRTAQINQLPVEKLYSDPQKTQFLQGGVKVEGGILTLPTQKQPLPATVYIDTADGNQEYRLINPQPQSQGWALYRSAQSSAPLPVATLPQFGHYDVQLIHFSDEEQNPYQVHLGEVKDGQFTDLHQQLGDKSPSSSAIALLKTLDGFVPVGIYKSDQKQLTSFESMEGLTSLTQPVKNKQEAPTKETETFYVLENEYIQLVFSNVGGALAEINLPFQSPQDEKSVVREIEFDRDMVKQHPYNAYFPARPYFTPDSADGSGMKYHDKGSLGGYYPLIRRDLIEGGNRKSVKVSPQYYALNLVSEYPELSELTYEVKHFDANSIVFEARQSHRRITKTFSFNRQAEGAPYCLYLDLKIEGDSRGLWLTSGVPEVEWISGAPAPSLKYRMTRNQKAEVLSLDLPKDSMTSSSVYPDWISNSNGFLGIILDPLSEIDPGFRVQYVSGTAVPSRLVEIDQEYNRYKAADMPGYMSLLPLKSTGGSMQFRAFAGPFDSEILKHVDSIFSNPATGYNPDYIASQTMHGWFTFISEPFAKFLWVLMRFFHTLSGSWALSIVLLTACLRLMLYPLNSWSIKSMARMQQIGPEVAAIQERYKKDPKKAQLEVMNFYREKGVNPASGCLPLLIQMPFLIGMFDLLKSSFALRGAPFIPGWIDDLTAPDVLFSWQQPIFFIGNEFHLLPILLALVMFAQQRFSSTAPKDPRLMTDQQRQQRAMGNMMTVVFAIMFYNFPSGLNIYWLSSMLLGMAQQWYITRQMQKNPLPIKATKAPAKK